MVCGGERSSTSGRHELGDIDVFGLLPDVLNGLTATIVAIGLNLTGVLTTSETIASTLFPTNAVSQSI